MPATDTSDSLVFRRTAIRFANAMAADDVDSTTWIPRSFATAHAFTTVRPWGTWLFRIAATAAGSSGFTSISRNSP